MALGTSIDTSTSRASKTHSLTDVVFHGDLIEFRKQQRCEACATRNKKCIIQHGEESCMLCNDADRQCIFERKIRLRGPANQFHWDTLVAVGSVFDADSMNAPHFSNMAVGAQFEDDQNLDTEFGLLEGSSTLQLSSQAPERVAQINRRQLSFPGSRVAADQDMGLSSQAHGMIHPVPEGHEEPEKSLGSTDETRSSTTAMYNLPCPAWDFGGDNRGFTDPLRYSSQKGATFLAQWHERSNPDPQLNKPRSGPSKPARLRSMTEEARAHARRVRSVRACVDCRKRKVKCTHVLPKDFREDGSKSPQVSQSPISRSSVVPDREQAQCASSTPEAPTAIQTASIGGLTTTLANEFPPHLQHDSARFRNGRISCPVPSCDSDFRGEHELSRHHERVHKNQRVVWVCNDISEDKTALAGCKSCIAGKQYNADYNAAEHLRRCHFIAKTQTQTARDSPVAENEEGRGVVEVPNRSMEELRKWLRKEWIRNEDRGTPCDPVIVDSTRDPAWPREEDWENAVEEVFESHSQQDAGWQALPEKSYEPRKPQAIPLF